MPEEENKQWTNDEARLLHHESLITEVLHRREGSGAGRKPAWQRFLESSGGTALISVLIGGIFGAIISANIQSAQKEREFQQSWLKARGDQAMIAYKDYLDRQQEVVKRVYERVGTSISAADDVISLTKTEFISANYGGEQKTGIEKYRRDIFDRFNASDAQWRGERDSLGLLINYYHPKQDNVFTAWHSVSDALNAYMDCAPRWVHDKVISDDISNACKSEKEQLKISIGGLTKALEEHRNYAWEGWETPEVLRGKLEQRPTEAGEPRTQK